MSGQKTPEQLAAEFKAAQDEANAKVKAIAEEALGKAKAGEALTEKLKGDADEALIKMNDLAGQVTELAQKMARGGGDGKEAAQSLGEQFVESEGFKAWADGRPRQGKSDMAVKATITTSTVDAAGSVGAATDRTRLPGMIEQPQRRLVVRDLISQGRINTAALEYIQEKGFTNNAGMHAEGTKKPESDIQLELIATSARTIAHWMKVSKQALSDVSQLRSHIDNRLLFGLDLKEEQQLLFGDGVGQNLLGIVPQATAYAIPAGVVTEGLTIIDTLRIAQLPAALALLPATGHVLNPIDWASIELQKDGMGRHIIGQPQGSAPASLWRLPVVETPAMAVGKFLTGAFQMGAEVFDLWDSRIEVGFENDDFTRNLLTILAEERIALALYRPEAFVYGDIAPAAGG
ncbi:phage major capsid protein [Paracoccus laeviglucosivorans]|uniref:Phage major capsid protein, HK97 family n=1 Tax=Paracoccus laeviglucosivorans TaxID=1197861 RepID=A0A521CX50_9RHOB|nr:phage major capsid protein [Paracoccus laeviglucosivorans]SMO64004.1 phage major capsid protein, HK97 family [Paracoccus laeviglucosivorans]